MRVVADTSSHFRDFRPYVASIDERGVVAFQATLADGATGIFTADENETRTIATSDELVRAFRSHPDIDDGICVYADLRDGREALLLHREGVREVVLASGGEFSHVGPLGPTMRTCVIDGVRSPMIAARCTDRSGPLVVSISNGMRRHGGYAAIHGLPVVCANGDLVLRTEEGIVAVRGGVASVVASGPDLGAFPSANDDGTIVFTSLHTGVFTVHDGRVRAVVEGSFESFRGALIDRAGRVVFYATPPRGTLGVFAFDGSRIERLLAIGDAFLGSSITELALNPVSMNSVGQLAVRLGLSNGVQAIVRI